MNVKSEVKIIGCVAYISTQEIVQNIFYAMLEQKLQQEILFFFLLKIHNLILSGPIPPMIGAELFRQGPRPRAMSLAGLANWIFTFIVAISFESIQVTSRI